MRCWLPSSPRSPRIAPAIATSCSGSTSPPIRSRPLGRVGELVARLKTNGVLTRYSPSSRVVELEALLPRASTPSATCGADWARRPPTARNSTTSRSTISSLARVPSATGSRTSTIGPLGSPSATGDHRRRNGGPPEPMRRAAVSPARPGGWLAGAPHLDEQTVTGLGQPRHDHLVEVATEQLTGCLPLQVADQHRAPSHLRFADPRGRVPLRGIHGRSVEREARIAHQVGALAGMRHRTELQLAVLERHLDAGDPRRPSARNVASVLCRCASNNDCTRAANAGCSRSKSLQAAIATSMLDDDVA